MSTTAKVALTDWIERLFQHRAMLKMGHAQRREDLNLGLGWLYYSLGRMLRPTIAVVIGSFRGFVPMVIAKALADNSEGGQVHFIDPSLVDDFWKDDAAVQRHFADFGIQNITHHLLTTQQFVETETYRRLGKIGLLFIDGYHSAEQARFDFEAFADKLAPQGMVLLHDSVWRLPSRMYGPGAEYIHSVTDFVADLKCRPEWQVLDFPFGDGATLVRRAEIPAPRRGGQQPTLAAR